MSNLAKGIWTTQDGRDVHLSNMETRHLKNLIRAIRDGRVFAPIDYILNDDSDSIFHSFMAEVIATRNHYQAGWLELLTLELSNRERRNGQKMGDKRDK